MPGVFFNTSKAELPAKVELFFGKNTVLPFTIRTDGVCFSPITSISSRSILADWSLI